jgi:hypothetical protein
MACYVALTPYIEMFSSLPLFRGREEFQPRMARMNADKSFAFSSSAPIRVIRG